ncbi:MULTISPECIES: peptidoglycan DD-metalloendopeptidase family protein [Okeania]|uniref:LysM peptidoglycan-binding domain-containing protein n=1 Tax=Okeania hirsuta TaxID=1458930 RepID=A0A3N6P9X0_9CYAN|nr:MULTISPECIES: peptidoglycan DD-metalloendopeptidase family protein [Okeania]NES75347.1 peptidoglycan DD-metalloendopeptidase family protein [Okeania sp. SIO1H4]NET19114.1 peptidoglycan DD-metalloendopeptidase family protein [Okeania sp. SIO1H5]NET75025.1 peptidoglycan DD-metalloendopeptidase family protein [Okeania sp. SIO1F9]NET92546.1 peptidoglycan DD-metalloendopeptidase family protein [Okeania sp. SIO1H2]RQH39660.1 LysM peptidoglycan-binding domain-containing protein [Okeania hirsuta]
MKRTFPSKGKSAAICELHTEATIDQSKQISIVGSKKTSSAAAMIGLAAISTTMGASGILLSGKGNIAVAAELPGVDTNKHELSTRELNVTGVSRSKGLLLQKLTQGYVEVEENTDSEVEATQPETVLPSEHTLGEKSFFPIELQHKYSQTKARKSEQEKETLVFSEPKINKLETNELPPLGLLAKVQDKEPIGSNSKLIDRLKVEINPVQKPENLSTKSSLELRYEQYISDPVGKSFDKSKEKFLENRNGKSENLVVEEPALQMATSSESDNSPTAKQVGDSQIDIAQESIKAQGTKLQGAVVIDSEMTSTPVSLVYKVRVGDTLSLIAKENNVSVEVLARANNIKNLDVIEAAKLLKIPQQPFSESLKLVSSTSSNSTKEEFSQPSLETTANQFNIPEAKLPNIKSNYLSYSVPSLTGAEVAPQRSVQLVSWSEGLNDQEHQIHKKPKEFSTLTQLVVTDSPKNPLVNKVWPDNLGARESRQNSFSNSQPVQPLPVDINTESDELLPTAKSEGQNNPYANRLRSEISRLREEYNNQKELEDSQIITSEAINIPVPEPSSSQQNLPNNSQILTENNSSRYLQPTYQEEVSSSQTTQWSEEMGTNRPEIRNPATVVKELPLEREISQSQGSSFMATSPTGANFNEILNNPSLGKMVSPDLPPLGKADTYLPGGSMQFTGYTWPSKGTLTSGYGWRWGRMHRGIDIAAPTGTPIVAAAPGVVTYANWNSGGYGNLVEIKHPNGSLTVYAHNSQILVREGQKVAQGELIAKMGSTGRSTGPHLHFEIHPTGNGAVNPMALLRSGVAYH